VVVDVVVGWGRVVCGEGVANVMTLFDLLGAARLPLFSKLGSLGGQL